MHRDELTPHCKAQQRDRDRVRIAPRLEKLINLPFVFGLLILHTPVERVHRSVFLRARTRR